MKSFERSRCALVMLLMLSHHGVANAAPTPEQQLAVNTSLWVSQFNSSLYNGKYVYEAIRDMVAASWSAFELYPQDVAVELAVSFVGTALAHQLPDGTFPWDFNGTANLDPNSVEFTSLPLTRLAWHYGSLLPPAFYSEVVPHLARAAEAVLAHHVPVYYTNIYTMRIVNLAMYGQILDNSTYTSSALSSLQEWGALVSMQGLHEYASPTYSAVALVNLLTGAADIQDQAIQAVLQPLVQYALADLGAGLFLPSSSMAGSHSRDYDFITGNSGVEALYSLTGLVPDAGMAPIGFSDPITEAQAWVLYKRGEMPTLGGVGDTLAQTLASIAAGGTRTVQQLWGLSDTPNNASLNLGMDRYVYCACGAACPQSGVCLGTSGAYYNNQQDKAVSAQFATGTPSPLNHAGRLAQLTKVHDPWDSPYGEIKTPDGSGHEKPTHLNFAQAAVQDGGAALIMSDLSPEFRENGKHTLYGSISTSITLPWNTDKGIWYWQGGAVSVQGLHQGLELPLPMRTPLAVWHGSAVLALRTFRIDGMLNYSANCAVKLDGPAGSYAGRWVCYHYNGTAVSFPGPDYPASRSGYLLAAAEGVETAADMTAFLSFFSAVNISDVGQVNGLWNVTVAPPPSFPHTTTAPSCPALPYRGMCSTMSQTLDLSSNGDVSRVVNGSAYNTHLFRVTLANGTVVDVTVGGGA